MHCTNLIKISAGLTKTTKISSAQESNSYSHFQEIRIMLNKVKYILVMMSWKFLP